MNVIYQALADVFKCMTCHHLFCATIGLLRKFSFEPSEYIGRLLDNLLAWIQFGRKFCCLMCNLGDLPMSI